MLQLVDVGRRSLAAYRGVAPDDTLDEVLRLARELRGARMGHKAREHCETMAAQCKQMMAGQFGAGGETGHKMPEHCEEMVEQFERRGEAVRA